MRLAALSANNCLSAKGRGLALAGNLASTRRAFGHVCFSDGMGRKVIEDDADLLGLGIMDIGKLAHALGEVACRAMFGDFNFAPRAVRVEEDEQVDGAIAPILAVVAFELTRCRLECTTCPCATA